MPSRRRVLLSVALASGLAGCTGSESTDPDSTTTGTTATTTVGRTETTTDAETTTPTVEPRMETPESEAVRWRVSFDVPLTYRPTVADGRVFVPVGDPKYGNDDPTVGVLAALDSADGTPQWTTRLPAAPTGRPRADASGVYCTVGGADGLGLHGRDQRCLGFAPDGTEEWRSETVDQFLHLLALDDDRAYLATSDDVLDVNGQTLFAVGRAEGRTRWSVETGDARDGRRVDGSLLVAPAGNSLGRHDARTGERRWQKRVTPLGSDATPFTLADGALFVGTNPTEGDERFAAIEFADASERWSYAKGGGKSFVPTGAAVAGETVVGTEYGGRVFALDVGDGSERWTFDADGETRQPPVVVDESVYVRGYRNDGDDVIHALDVETGSERWRATVPGFATSVRPVGETVVVASSETGGSIRALDAADGSERWSFYTYENVTSPVVVGETVLVTSERGVVRAIRG